MRRMPSMAAQMLAAALAMAADPSPVSKIGRISAFGAPRRPRHGPIGASGSKLSRSAAKRRGLGLRKINTTSEYLIVRHNGGRL